MTLALGTRAKNEFFDHRLHPNHHFRGQAKVFESKAKPLFSDYKQTGLKIPKAKSLFSEDKQKSLNQKLN